MIFRRSEPNDLQFRDTANGVTFAFTSTHPQYVREVLINRLNLWVGEYFPDARIGAPWRAVVFDPEVPDVALIEQMITDVILATPGVASVISLTATRYLSELSLLVTIQLTDGSELVLDSSQDPAFIVGAI